MLHAQSLEYLCDEINRMGDSARMQAIEILLHATNVPIVRMDVVPRQRGRLSELEGIGGGMWDGMDVDKFIRAERDSWNS